jgi:hypothetical protein
MLHLMGICMLIFIRFIRVQWLEIFFVDFQLFRPVDLIDFNNAWFDLFLD